MYIIKWIADTIHVEKMHNSWIKFSLNPKIWIKDCKQILKFEAIVINKIIFLCI